MERHIIVALWARESAKWQKGAALSIDTRINALSKKLSKVEKKRKELSARAGIIWSEPQAIFIAPEYLFCEPSGFYKGAGGIKLPRVIDGRDTDQTRAQLHMDESRLKKVLSALKEVSRKFQNTMILPGTIAWWKPVKDPEYVITRMAPGGHVAYRPGTGDIDGRKLDRAESIVDIKERPATKGLSAKESRAILKNAKMCFNTATVWYKGKRVFVYNKHTDFDETNHAYDGIRKYEIAIPGVRAGIFRAPNSALEFGIEICFDHNEGVLRTQAAGQVDFHIVTSAFVTLEPANYMARPGGYVLHASIPQHGVTEVIRIPEPGEIPGAPQTVPPNWADEGVDHNSVEYRKQPGIRVYDLVIDY